MSDLIILNEWSQLPDTAIVVYRDDIQVDADDPVNRLGLFNLLLLFSEFQDRDLLESQLCIMQNGGGIGPGSRIYSPQRWAAEELRGLKGSFRMFARSSS